MRPYAEIQVPPAKLANFANVRRMPGSKFAAFATFARGIDKTARVGDLS